MALQPRTRLTALLVGAAALAAVPVIASAQTTEAEPVTPSTAGWELIPRNTIGSPDYHFGTGAIGANQGVPGGEGSLQLLVEGDQKIAYGMPQTPDSALWGTPVSGLGELSYWVMDATEEEGGNAALPNLTIEVARNGVDAGDPGYASFVFLPNDSTPDDGSEDLQNWEMFDAKAGMWFSTGGTDCPLATPCTWDELNTAYPDSEVWFSIGVAKGRDNAFTGAVDLVTIDGTTYDFEPGTQADNPDDLPPVAGPDRIGGDDRYATAVQVAEFRFPGGSPAVYIARGDDFADSLAANTLRGPVLLVRTCDLPMVVQDYLATTQPQRVTALGGTGAVCDQVLQDAQAAAGIS